MHDSIIIRGAKEHNLKNISLELPRNKLIVFTGLSGSGKSTLAMDTIFAEGQRRYLESLSSYARQFLGQLEKPDVESIEGLSPTIAIDQKAASHNPRSTVGTVTEIYDYLRLLYARIGIPHCPKCGTEIHALSTEQIIEKILDTADNQIITIFAPVVRERRGEYSQLLQDIARKGFVKVRINGKVQRIDAITNLARYKQHTIEVVVDEFLATIENLTRLTEAVEAAIKLADGLVGIIYKSLTEEILNQKLSCPNDGSSLPELAPRLFSFNSPQGACPTCDGLGVKREFDVNLILPDLTRTIAEGALLPWNFRPNSYYSWYLRQVCSHFRIAENVRLKDLPAESLELLINGPAELAVIPVTWRSQGGDTRQFRIRFNGIIHHLEERYKKTDSAWFEKNSNAIWPNYPVQAVRAPDSAAKHFS